MMQPPSPDIIHHDRPQSILFVCTHNYVRSPMAEGFTKHYFGHEIYIDSAGLKIEHKDAHPFSIAVMEELNLDISKHKAKLFDDMTDSSFDLVITLSPEAHHRALELTRTHACEVEYWPTFDPTATEGNREAILNSFREVRDLLARRIKERLTLHQSPAI